MSAIDANLQDFLLRHGAYLDKTIATSIPLGSLLSEAAHYALDSGGKRLRPALTLMVAQSLNVPFQHVTPLVQSIELIHTSSLLFDDLPAQDNATLRRGKTVTHIQFNEWTAQLTGIAMLVQGLGVIPELEAHFMPQQVLEVERYISSLVGIDGLCKGQAMDLSLKSGALKPTEATILEMQQCKTSLLIEASLVPLLILTDRDPGEINAMKQFAHHAGIVFQIRDDILDVTSTETVLGKDSQHDSEQGNIARQYGLARAQGLLDKHMEAAINACETLPFDTILLQATVRYFAARKR